MPNLQFCVCGITTPCPAAATGLMVTNIGPNGATFAYTPNPNGSFTYDLSLVPQTGGATIILPNIPSPYNATTLVSGMTYTPSVVTRCLTGSAFRVTGAPFTTTSTLNAPQPTPSAIGPAGFTISWVAIPHANQYLVQVYSTANFSGTPIYTGTTAGLTYVLGSQPTGTTIYYRVEAQDTTAIYANSAFGTGSATTTSASLVAHYGIGNAAPATVADIIAGLSQAITHNADITIPWPTNSTPLIYWMAFPQTEPDKLHSNDGLFPEPIGPNQTYGTAILIGTWKLLATGNPTSNVTSTTFTNS